MECCDRALMVLDDPADAVLGLSTDARGVDLSCSAVPVSYDSLVANGCLPGSSEGRVFSCLEEVDGRDGGDGGAPSRKVLTLLNVSGCSHENCACGRVSWKIKEFLCSVFPRGNEKVEYTYEGAAPVSLLVSGKLSLCMLTGVCAVSSARTNEGWLSDDACRVGISTGAGMPVRLALLNGLEKLNEGFGRRVPPTDISELTDVDLALEYRPGEMPVGDDDKPLPIDGF
jgi:hypothetical protein